MNMGELATIPLTGKALLQRVKELSDLPKRELARRCGYFTHVKGEDGEDVRVNLTEFYEALIEARGYVLDPEREKDGRGREPTYRVSVHKNGQIVIGAAYTKSMNLKPGDQFEIRPGYKHIHLRQVDRDGSLVDTSDEDE